MKSFPNDAKPIAKNRTRDMQNLYISYCHMDDVVNAYRLQTLAVVTGRFVVFVPPAKTRFHGAKLDSGSRYFLRTTRYILRIGNQDKPHHPVCNEEFRLTSGSKITEINIDYDWLKVHDTLLPQHRHSAALVEDWPEVDWYPMRGVCWVALGLLMMTIPDENLNSSSA